MFISWLSRPDCQTMLSYLAALQENATSLMSSDESETHEKVVPTKDDFLHSTFIKNSINFQLEADGHSPETLATWVHK